MDKYCPPCDIITAQEAIDNCWMSPYKMYKVLLEVDLTDYLKANQEFFKHFSFFQYDFDKAMTIVTDIWEQQKYAKQVNCDVKEVKAHAYGFMRALQFRKQFIANHPKKIEIAKKIIAARSDKKIITFDSSIKQCESYGMGYTVHSDKKQKENLAIIEEFSKMSTGVIHSSKMLIEGLDCPGLSVAIVTGFNSSQINAKQSLGRVVRFEKGKMAEIFVLVLKGTVEESWFSKSQEGSNFVVLDEDELDYILINQELHKTMWTQEKTNVFRY